MIWLLFEAEGVDKSVVLLKIVAIFEEKNDFVYVILGGDG